MHPKALTLQNAGLAHQKQGELPQAREAYLQALALDARLDAARLNLAAVLTELGDFDGAIAQYRTLLDIQPDQPRAMFGMVRALAGARRHGEAQQVLDRLVTLGAEDLPVAKLQAWLSGQATGHPATPPKPTLASEAQASEAPPAGPQAPDIAERLAQAHALLTQNQAPEAIAHLRETLRVAPGEVRAHFLLAEALLRGGDGEGAWEAYAEVTIRQPDAQGLRERLIALCRQQAHAAEGPQATRWWERLQGLLPSDLEATQALEQSYSSQSRVMDLIRLLQSQAERAAEPSVIVRLGQALGAINRTAEALALYRQTLEEQPEALEVRRAAATLALLDQQPGVARQLLSEVVDLPPDARLLLARANFEEGRTEEGWGALKPLLTHDDVSERAQALGAEVIRPFAQRLTVELKDARGAATWWRRLLTCRQGDEQALDALESLYRELNRPQNLAEILALRPPETLDAGRLQGLIDAWLSAGRPDAAHAALLDLAARAGNPNFARLELASLSLTMGHATQAWQELEPLLKPPSTEAAKLAAEIARQIALKLQDNGDYAKALGWWKLHLHYHPQSPDLKRMADAQLAAGDLAGAMQTLRECLRRQPEDEETLLTLAGFELAEGRYAEAAALFQAILKQHPDHLRAVQGMAEAAAGIGNDDASLAWSQRLLEITHDEIPELIHAAQQAIGRNDDEEAWEALRKVLQKDPKHTEALDLARTCLKRMAESYYGEIALAWWKELLTIDPQNLEALRELARGAVEAGRKDEATLRYQELASLEPSDPDAALWLGREHLEAGRHEDARQTLSRSKEARERLDGVLIQAELALIDGETQKARVLFGKAVGMSRGNAPAMAGLAKVTLAEGKPGDAWVMFKRLLQTPDAAKIRDEALTCLRRLIQASPGTAAAPWWEEVLKLEPRSLEAHHAVATLHHDAGKLDTALAYAHRALGLAPDDRDTLRLLAEILRDQGHVEMAARTLQPLVAAGSLEAIQSLARIDRDLAVQALEDWLEREPSRKDLRRILADWALEAGNHRQAWPHLEILLSQEPDRALVDVACSCLEALASGAKDTEEAVGWWEKLLELAPDHGRALGAVANSCRAKGHVERATELTRRLIALGTSTPEVAMSLGASLELQNQLDDARKAYAQAAQAQYPDAFLALGRLSMLSGETAQAQLLLERAAKLAPGTQTEIPLAQAYLANGEALKAWEILKPWLSKDDPPKRLARTALDQLIEAASDESVAPLWQERLKLDARDPEAHAALFRLALAQGDVAAQERHAPVVLEADPEHADAALVLGLALHRSGEDAEQLLTIAARADRAEAFLPLALSAWKQGDAKEARNWLERHQARYPTAADALKLQLELARHDGASDKEWDVLERLEAAAPDAELLDAKKTLVQRQLENLAPEEASSWVERALALDMLAPLEALAESWLSGGSAESARDLFTRLKEHAPERAGVHKGLGEAFLKLGNRKEALGALQTAYQHGERGPVIIESLMELTWEANRHEEAGLWSQRLIEAMPDHTLAHERRREAARALARKAAAPEEQQKWWLALLKLVPDDPEALRMAAAITRALGDSALAARLLAQLHRVQPNDLSVLLSLADACQETGNRAGVRRALELAQGLEPEDLGLRARLAALLIEDGDAPAAESALAEILHRDPENQDALKVLAGLKLESAPEEALGLLEDALKLGDDPTIRQLAVECAEQLARSREGAAAIETWKRVLGIDPGHIGALRAIADDRLAAGRPDEALAPLFSLVKHDPAPETLFELAQTLLACRRLHEASAFFLTLANQYDYLPAWRALAEMGLASGNLEAAHDAAHRLLRDQAPGAVDLVVRAARGLARRAEDEGDDERAHGFWSEALEHAPKDVEALEGLAQASENLGKFEEAEAFLRRLEPLDPSPRSSVKLAEILIKRGLDDEAEKLFARALATDPEEPHAHAALARLAQGRGDFLNAGDHAQRALARMPDDKLRVLAGYCARQLAEASRLKREVDQAFLFADLWAAYSGKTLDWWRFRAELARDAGRASMAIALYRGILVSHPEAPEDALSLTRCYPDPREAKPLLEGLLAERPHTVAAAHALAMLALDDSDMDGAIAWWNQALDHAPSNATLWRRLADCYRRNGRYPEACAAYARLEELIPADPVLLKAWGNAALSGELWKEARTPFEKLAETHGDRGAMLTLAEVATTLEDHGEAWRWSQALLDSDAPPAEAETLAMQAAKALAEGAAGQEALGWWERYLDLAPGDVDAFLSKARILRSEGQLEEAIATLHHTLELAPGDGTALRLLADCYREIGDLGAAEDVLQTALHEDPKDAEALFALAEMAWDRGEIQLVWELGQQLLALNNRNPQAQGLIARCAKLLAEEASAQGDWENAILYWELLLSFDIDEETALQSLSQAYVNAGRYAEAVGIQREVVRIFPEDPDRRFRLGEIAVMGGFWEEARATFLELREADPSHVPTHHALASVALALDDGEAAEGHYLDALAQNSHDLKARIGLARLYMTERPKQAWDVLKPAASEPPVKGEVAVLSYQALDRLAEEAIAQSHFAEAVEHRREAVALDPQGEDSTARLWRRKLASSLVAAGRKPEAVRELASLLDSDPGDVEASYLLGSIHRQSSDLESACRVFERILDLQPTHVEARIALAEIDWEISDLDGAWTHVQEALQVQPMHEAGRSLFRKLALAFAERSQQDGDLSEAVQWWNLVWRQDQRDLETLRKMARAHIALGQLSAAADCYAFALDLDPKDLETAHILADIHRQRGDLKAAEKPLLRIVALDPRHAPSLRALLKLARDRNNAPEALKRAYDLLDVEPDDPESLFIMAWSHQQMLERRAALEACKELVAIDPQHAEGHHLMGQIARDLGDFDLAKKVLTTALYLRPCAAYYHTMGTIYSAMGYSDESLASFNQALGMDPDHAEAHADLGLGLIRMRQIDKAKPHLQKAFNLIPRDTERSLAIQCALDLV
ncbi:tetratricopeptide repeat protein [compost metagenome]